MTEQGGPARGPWQTVGLAVLFVVVSLAIMTPLVWGGSWLMLGELPSAGGPELSLLQLTLLQGVTGTVSAIAATFLVGRRMARLSWAQLRWSGVGRTGRAVLVALALGAAVALLAPVAATAVGDARWVRDEGGILAWLGATLTTALVLLPAAAYEELMFRGVPLVLLAGVIGRVPAALLLAVLFGLGHLANPDPSFLGIANIALAGLFLAAVFYGPGGIWAATAAHVGWNAALAAMDAPVSGLPFAVPLLDYLPGGPAWLTGGEFGPEGGVLATLTLGLGLALAWRRAGKDGSTA